MYDEARPTGAKEPLRNDSLSKRLPPGFNPFVHPSAHFVPNSFSRRDRITNAILALLLIAYGVIGVYIDDLFIPGKRTGGVHLHGLSAWLMFGAIVSGASVLLALIIDHYDRRNNEHRYVLFKRYATTCGWLLFCSALVWHVNVRWQ